MKYKFIAGVSGGPDSMAMLDIYKKDIIAVCHVNYNKRKDSNIDLEIVKKYCLKNNINFYALNVTDDLYSKYKINNFQKLARLIRYDFFLEVANKLNCFHLLLAHNRNDFLETAYMQIYSKKKNLFYGIRKKSYFNNLKIYRPLIKKWKKDLENYCIKNNIKYQIDYTNNLDIYERNKIRKLINKWNFFNKYFFIIFINLKNLKNFFIKKRIDKLYFKWKLQNYNINYIKEIIYKKRLKLIYNFLEEFNLKRINYNIIKNFDDFILKNKKGIKKEFRLSNSYKAIIVDEEIKIIGK